jgi:hypothetical protein
VGARNPPADPEGYAAATRERSRFALLRAGILAQQPVLSHVDAEGAQELLRMKDGELRTALVAKNDEVEANIRTTRENIASGKLPLWGSPQVVRATETGLGVTDPQRRGWLSAKVASVKNWELAKSIGMAVLQVGLGIAATLTTGPLGVALAIGASAVGAVDAVDTTSRYLTRSAAAGAAVQREEGMFYEKLDGEWVWVGLAWLGAGLAAADVVRAIRLARAGRSAREISEAVGGRLPEARISKDLELLGIGPKATRGAGTANHAVAQSEGITGHGLASVKGVDDFAADAGTAINRIRTAAGTKEMSFEKLENELTLLAERVLARQHPGVPSPTVKLEHAGRAGAHDPLQNRILLSPESLALRDGVLVGDLSGKNFSSLMGALGHELAHHEQLWAEALMVAAKKELGHAASMSAPTHRSILDAAAARWKGKPADAQKFLDSDPLAKLGEKMNSPALRQQRSVLENEHVQLRAQLERTSDPARRREITAQLEENHRKYSSLLDESHADVVGDSVRAKLRGDPVDTRVLTSQGTVAPVEPNAQASTLIGRPPLAPPAPQTSTPGFKVSQLQHENAANALSRTAPRAPPPTVRPAVPPRAGVREVEQHGALQIRRGPDGVPTALVRADGYRTVQAVRESVSADGATFRVSARETFFVPNGAGPPRPP